MIENCAATVHSGSGVVRIILRVIAAADCIPYWFIALSAPVFPSAVFWQSGETKVSGWHLKPSAVGSSSTNISFR
jgi:putative oxidoreductase